MSGICYGVSVGPGDPELMTLKACRIIKECGTVAFPDSSARTAYRIAEKAVPEIHEKNLLPLKLPMTRDQAVLERSHMEAAGKIREVLDRNKDVAFLTLGDVTVYSTFAYIQSILEQDGCEVRLVSGVPSFCAAAAELKVPLVLGDTPLEVTTAGRFLDGSSAQPVFCLMKAGPRLKELKQRLSEAGMDADMASDLGMESQKLYSSLREMPDSAGYFSTVLAKKKE